MNVKEIDCPYTEQNDLTVRYLAGKLPDREAEALEVHVLGCPRCWVGIRLAGEVRETLGQRFVQQVSTDAAAAGRKRDFWPRLAAAAAVVIAVLGVWQLIPKSRETQSHPV